MVHCELPLATETGHHSLVRTMCVCETNIIDAYLPISTLSRHVNISISHNHVLSIVSSYKVVFVVSRFSCINILLPWVAELIFPLFLYLAHWLIQQVWATTQRVSTDGLYCKCMD